MKKISGRRRSRRSIAWISTIRINRGNRPTTIGRKRRPKKSLLGSLPLQGPNRDLLSVIALFSIRGSRPLVIASLLLTFTFGCDCFAQSSEPSSGDVALAAPSASSFEELPELKASEILKPEFLKGPHHTVRESVPTSSGQNQFVIDSDFGLFEAEGNEMLQRRVKEVYAIADLKDVSRTDQFKNSLVAAAKGPYNAAKNIIKDPVTSISNVPKGVMKFMGRAGQSVKNIGKKREKEDPREGNRIQQMSGYSKK